MTENSDAPQATETGAAVRRRVTSVDTLRSMMDQLRTSTGPILLSRARIQGLIDGNPPFSQAELDRLGRGYQTNVNFREAEAIIDAAAAAAYELAVESENVAQTRILEPFRPPEPAVTDYERVVNEEYTELLSSWPGFFQHLDMANRQALSFGYGAMVWPNEWDWRPKAFKSSAFLFPAKAPVEASGVTFFFLFDEFEVSDLLNLDEGELSKWNAAEARRIVAKALSGSPRDHEGQLGSLETTLERLRAGDSSLEPASLSPVPVVHALVRESTGLVSHYIFDDSHEAGGFLYKCEDRYPAMDRALWLLPFNYGDGLLRGVKGLGHRIYHHCELSNRSLGQVFDAGGFAASLILQSDSPGDSSDLAIIRGGPVTRLPAGVTPIQHSFAPPIEGLVRLRQLSESILHSNTGVYRPQMANAFTRSPEKTAAQVYSEESKEARFEKNQAMQRYLCWDRLHTEIFRRLRDPKYLFAGFNGNPGLFLAELEGDYEGALARMAASPTFQNLPGRVEALGFILRCVQRGVPLQLLLDPDAFKIRATRSIGIGSPSLKMQALDRLMAAAGRMGDRERRHTEREWSASMLGGWHQVDRFFPKASPDTPSNQASIAQLENNDMDEGHQVVVGSDQLHGDHLPVHARDLVQTAHAFLENPASVDPQRAVQRFATRVPHILAHLQYLAADPTRKEQVGGYVSMLRELKGVYQMIEEQAKGILQAQEEERKAIQQRLAEADERTLAHRERMEDIRLRHEERMVDVQSLNEKRMVQLQNSVQVSIERTLSQIEDQRRRTDAEIESMQRKAAAATAAAFAKTQNQ